MTVTQLPPETDFGLSFEDLLDFDAGEGFRTELLEGRFVVSPPAFIPHVVVAGKLHELLVGALPSGFKVYEVPGVYVDENNYFIPDLVVVPIDALERYDKGFLPQDLVLAAEVVSPSSRIFDNVVKRTAYGKAGIRAYWILDPKAKSLLMLELRDGSYVETDTAPLGLHVDRDEVFRP